METLSFFKLWRNTVTDATTGKGHCEAASTTTSAKTSTDNDACDQAMEMHDQSDDEDSFFDLVFTTPSCDSDKPEDNCDSAQKDSFFKGKVFPLEPNSKPQSPISLLRSAPKLRVFMFGFRKSKSEKMEKNDTPVLNSHNRQRKSSRHEESKRFSAKCKVEDVQIASQFTRDNSLRSKLLKERSDEASIGDSSRRFPKDLAHKYAKLIKPLYVGVSKRYSENNLMSDELSTVTPLSSPGTAAVRSPRHQTEQKQWRRANGFRMVCKNLGKIRSTRPAFGTTQSPAGGTDDSLLLQHDGIQSAILHCKSSYNSSKDCSPLSQSNPSRERPNNFPINSAELEKRCRI